MNRLRPILLVEDDMLDAELALNAFSEYKLANEVVHVRDGADALDYLYRRESYADRAEADPVVVLLDLKMPRVGGLEVLKTMKSDPALQAVPVVILTSSREETDLIVSYKLGANAYVVKPVDFEAFVKAVHDLGAFWAVLNEPPPSTPDNPTN